MINLSTASLEELRVLIVDTWDYPTFRANQVYDWIRHRGVTDAQDMTNLPLALREQLKNVCRPHALELVDEWVKDGTVQRTYRCGGVVDRQMIIESVLMGPYQDGRYTACISSQAEYAQLDFVRQLTADEIVEQVARFQSLLQLQSKQQHGSNQLSSDDRFEEEKEQERRPRKRPVSTTTATVTSVTSIPRLSNVVFMGMGEPLANYKNVKFAIRRITSELGIGARKITIRTVGIPLMIRHSNSPCRYKMVPTTRNVPNCYWPMAGTVA
jgi:23S rRNA (adenine2503-C2)-methyltransferase